MTTHWSCSSRRITLLSSLSLSLTRAHTQEMALQFQSAPIQSSSGFTLLKSRYNFVRSSLSPNFSQISEVASNRRLSHCWAIRTACDLDVVSHTIQPLQLVSASRDLDGLEMDIPDIPHALSEHLGGLLALADLDPASAKFAIALVGPLLSGLGFLFILRIVMSWYPRLPVGKFPYVIAYAPTEPLLSPTRKLIKPVGGVDVTPVVWFAIISFLNEILVGPQGLLVLLSQQV